MATLKPLESVSDWVGSNLGGSGGMMYTTAPQHQAMHNVIDSSVYTAESGVNLWEASHLVNHRVNNYISEMNTSSNSLTIGSDIRTLTTGADILLAEGEMVGYIMCHPGMQQGYKEGADYYEGWKPGKLDTPTCNPYHDRLMDGMLVEEDDHFVVHTYSDDSLLDQLTFDEKLKILNTHAVIDSLDLPELYESYYILED